MLQWQNNTVSGAFHHWQNYVVTKTAHSTKVDKLRHLHLPPYACIWQTWQLSPPPCREKLCMAAWACVFTTVRMYLHCMISRTGIETAFYLCFHVCLIRKQLSASKKQRVLSHAKDVASLGGKLLVQADESADVCGI